MNKEDIWVCRVPAPIRASVEAQVNDLFDDLELGGVVTDWNIYSPLWAPVEVAGLPSTKNKSLRLQDGDPYDYARATRVFPESKNISIAFKLLAEHADRGRLDVEILDAAGHCPVRLTWAETGTIQVNTGKVVNVVRPLASFKANEWVEARLSVDAGQKRFSVSLDGKLVLADAPFADDADSVERISFRTGEPRPIPREQAPVAGGPPNESLYYAGSVPPQTDHPIAPAVFHVDDVRTLK